MGLNPTPVPQAIRVGLNPAPNIDDDNEGTIRTMLPMLLDFLAGGVFVGRRRNLERWCGHTALLLTPPKRQSTILFINYGAVVVHIHATGPDC